VDTICGHARGKKASSEDTGQKPFLYLVKKDDVYVVDGKADSPRRSHIGIFATEAWHRESPGLRARSAQGLRLGLVAGRNSLAWKLLG
jgi:hypothetical protein